MAQTDYEHILKALQTLGNEDFLTIKSHLCYKQVIADIPVVPWGTVENCNRVETTHRIWNHFASRAILAIVTALDVNNQVAVADTLRPYIRTNDEMDLR